MSTISDAVKGIKELLSIQTQVENLERAVDRQGDEMRKLVDNLIAVDKRVIRIETMIEMTGGRTTPQPRIED